MPDIEATLVGDRIVPTCDAYAARLERIPRGPTLRMSIVKPRTLPLHKGYWGPMVSSTAEALRDGPTGLSEIDDEWVMTMFASAAGLAAARPMTKWERRIYGDEPQIAARYSTRWSNMDQSTFMRLVDGARDVLSLPAFGWMDDHPIGRDARDFCRQLGAEI